MMDQKRRPVYIGSVDPDDIRKCLAKTPEELEREFAEDQAAVEAEWRDWLSYYGDDGKLKPGVMLPSEHYMLACAALGHLCAEDRVQYIKEAKAWFGVS